MSEARIQSEQMNILPSYLDLTVRQLVPIDQTFNKFSYNKRT